MNAETASPAQDTSGTNFSRSSGLPLSLGKCTERMSADMPDFLFEAATKRRLALNMGEAEYLRFCVMRDALGNEVVRRMHEQQLQVLLGSGPESGS